jgi:hypothetical protein
VNQNVLLLATDGIANRRKQNCGGAKRFNVQKLHAAEQMLAVRLEPLKSCRAFMLRTRRALSSKYAHKPFVSVVCWAIPPFLMRVRQIISCRILPANLG